MSRTSAHVVSALAPAIVFAVLVAVYKFLATAGSWEFRDTASAYFDALGDSFLHGHLYLPGDVPSALLALQNPYDPAQRSGIPASWPWDSSLYNGHLYLYWGPASAVVHAIWHLRSRVPLFESQFGVFVGLATCGLFWLLLAQLRTRAFPGSSGLLVWGSVLGFGLGGMMPYLVARPSVYHSPILLGTLFLVASLYCLIVACETATSKLWFLCLTGAFLGCAIASRLTYVAYAIAVGLVLVWTLVRSRASWGQRARELVVFCAPLVLTMVALLAYNWARFESPFEFGQKYQLAGTDQTHLASSCGSNLVGYFGLYFASVPRLETSYPFVAVDIGPALVFPATPPTVFPPERFTQMISQEPPIMSAFLLVPVGLLVFSAPFLGWRGHARRGAAAVLFATVLGLVATTGLLSCADGVDARYFGDVTPALSLAGTVVLLAWSQRLSADRCSTAAHRTLVAFAAAAWTLSIPIAVIVATTAWAYWAPEAIQRIFGVTIQ